MALNDEQKKIIEPKLSVKCPLCGGQVLHHTTPAQLFFNEFNPESKTSILNFTENAEYKNYVVGECQNCGYTILRSLSILLRQQGEQKERQ